MPDQRKRRNVPAKLPDHIFIDQGPQSFQQDHSRLVSSQARRFQSAGKRQQQRLSARQDAGYVRSLVGWKSTSSTPSVESRERGSGSPLKSKSPEQQQTIDEIEQQDKTSQPQISLSIRTGLRVDPFSAFPSSNTRTVMLQVDYYIHVWAPHKAGNFDDLMGYNTQLDLCWPVAMQDDMLFDATVAVSRTAWVLAQGKDPSEDQFVLYHRGLAMASLRQKLSSAKIGSKEACLFTIGRMISIAYMSSEAEAFIAHFEAFQKIAQKYIDEHPHSDVARVLQNRLDSWTALHGYRTGQNLLREDIIQPQSTSLSPSRPSTSPKRQLRTRTLTLLAGLDLPIGIARPLKLLTQLLGQMTTTSTTPSKLAPELTEYARKFSEMLRSCDDLTATDLQLCCAVVALCLQLREHLLLLREGVGPDMHLLDDHEGIVQVDDIAKTFINQKLEGFSDSDEQRMTLTWSALTLGSFLLQQSDNRLRTKGHIIHMNLSLHLGVDLVNSSPRYDDGSTGWGLIESMLNGPAKTGSLWHSELAEQWRRDWQGSLKRQRRWEKQGVWMIGAPKRLSGHAGRNSQVSPDKGERIDDTRSPGVPALMLERDADVDIIEYLVLREARDSLPRVE